MILTGTSVIVVLTVALCSLLMYFPNIHIAAVRLDEGWSVFNSETHSVMDLFKDETSEADSIITSMDEILQGHDFRLELPIDVTSQAVSIENVAVDKAITLSIKGLSETYLYEYPMYGTAENIEDITYFYSNKTGYITLYLNKVYELVMERVGEYLYFDLKDPHEVYDYVVCIDAGHGGNVPGAVKQDIYEKDIDLQIVQALKDVFERSNESIGVYYTRLDDSNPSFEARANLPNDCEADVFISIHNNSTASGRMSSIQGTEVMYRGGDSTGESKKLAKICLDNLTKDLGSKSKGTVVGDEIYIIRSVNMPVALIELGFMTNKEELANLTDPVYQKKAAESIYRSVIEYLHGRE